jgi:hypothetical protein
MQAEFLRIGVDFLETLEMNPSALFIKPVFVGEKRAITEQESGL